MSKPAGVIMTVAVRTVSGGALTPVYTLVASNTGQGTQLTTHRLPFVIQGNTGELYALVQEASATTYTFMVRARAMFNNTNVLLDTTLVRVTIIDDRARTHATPGDAHTTPSGVSWGPKFPMSSYTAATPRSTEVGAVVATVAAYAVGRGELTTHHTIASTSAGFPFLIHPHTGDVHVKAATHHGGAAFLAAIRRYRGLALLATVTFCQ